MHDMLKRAEEPVLEIVNANATDARDGSDAAMAYGGISILEINPRISAILVGRSP
jgi:hypothetical protein